MYGVCLESILGSARLPLGSVAGDERILPSLVERTSRGLNYALMLRGSPCICARLAWFHGVSRSTVTRRIVHERAVLSFHRRLLPFSMTRMKTERIRYGEEERRKLFWSLMSQCAIPSR